MPRRYLLNRVGRRVALPEQRESPDTHRVRVVLRCQRPIERQRKDRHPSLSGPRAFKILGAGKCRLVLQPGFYVRLKKSQTESIAGLYGHALPAPANMLISYMANRKPGCSTNLRLPTQGGFYAWEFEQRGRELNVRVEGPIAFNTPTLTLEAALA